MEEEKKEITPVVSGKVRKKNAGDKVVDFFTSEDFKGAVIPRMQDTAFDILLRLAEMVFFPSSRGYEGRRRTNRGRASYVSYSNRYDYDREPSYRRRVDDDRISSRYNVDCYEVDSLGDAEEAIMTMEELVNKYRYATVADLKTTIGVTPSHTDNKWGWTDCRDFHYRRSRGRYVLDFEPPVYLD